MRNNTSCMCVTEREWAIERLWVGGGGEIIFSVACLHVIWHARYYVRILFFFVYSLYFTTPTILYYTLLPMINAFLRKIYFHNTSLQAYFVEAGTCYKQIKNSTLFQRFEMLQSIYVKKSAVLFSYLRFFPRIVCTEVPKF